MHHILRKPQIIITYFIIQSQDYNLEQPKLQALPLALGVRLYLGLRLYLAVRLYLGVCFYLGIHLYLGARLYFVTENQIILSDLAFMAYLISRVNLQLFIIYSFDV